jgi:iron complex transport system substrate-binding protein
MGVMGLFVIAGGTASGVAEDPNVAEIQESARPAQRIISLVPAATEALFPMGAGSSVVGVSSYDTWPPEVAALPKVGALLDPDEEKILRLQPDFAILDPGHTALARKLRGASIASYGFPHADLEGTFEAMEEMARAVGREQAGVTLTTRLRQELELLRIQYSNTRAPRTLIVFGRNPGSFHNLFVIGGSGFIHELVEIAGGDNVFADVERMSFKVSLESVLSRAPEAVIEVRPANEGAVDVAELAEEWRRLPGFDQATISILTDNSLLIPGPRMPSSVRLIAEHLHAHRP